jgi:hypothetical protein
MDSFNKETQIMNWLKEAKTDLEKRSKSKLVDISLGLLVQLQEAQGQLELLKKGQEANENKETK